MYQIGEQVIYGNHGVCRITDQEKRVIDRKTVTYLVLEPAGQEGARYLVPLHNPAAMAKLRPVLTSRELEGMIASDEIRNVQWISDESLRKQNYRELITSGDRAALMGMVHMLYGHRKTLAAAGKRMHMADENFLKDAEKLLAGEISAVLGFSAGDAITFLRSRLSEA